MNKEDIQGFSLKDYSAALIGVGGLGCNIAVHLAGAGIGKLLLWDFDLISESNLNRQFIYNYDDIGKSKCITAAEKLSLYSPDTQIVPYDKKITKEKELEDAKDCDIVFLAVDNRKARKIAEFFCAENSIPLVCGGINGFFGKVYLYIPDVTPCPECAGMDEQSDHSLSVSATAGIIGAFEASLGIQYLITGNTSLGGKLTVYDGDSFHALGIRKTYFCPRCRELTEKRNTYD